MGDLSDNEYDPAAVYKARLIHLANRADAQFHIQDHLATGRQYAVDHPLVTISALVTLLLCSFPIVMFVAFVLTTLFCTFMSFIFVEGILLTIGGAILGTVLLATGIMSVFVTLTLVSAWLLFTYGNKLVQKVVQHTACDSPEDSSNQEPDNNDDDVSMSQQFENIDPDKEHFQ